MDPFKASTSEACLKAITINGSIQVESEADAEKRAERRKNRKSRWGKDPRDNGYATGPKRKSDIVLSIEDKSGLIGGGGPSSRAMTALPTMIDASKMDEKQQQIYVLKLQIQESTMKLARPDLGTV